MAAPFSLATLSWLPALGVAGIAVFGVATGGFLVLRAETRRQTLAFLEGDQRVALVWQFQKPMNLPPLEELASSMVPLWEITDPYAAADDIGRNGRKSRFWPAQYRKPGALGQRGEDQLLLAIRAIATNPELQQKLIRRR